MPTTSVEVLAALYIADRNGEMRNTLDIYHRRFPHIAVPNV